MSLRRRGAKQREEEGLRESLLNDSERDAAHLEDSAAAGGDDQQQAGAVQAYPNAQAQYPLGAVVESLRLNIAVLFTKLSQCCLWLVPMSARPLKLGPLAQERLADLRERIAMPYVPENEEHCVALRKLWNAAFAPEPPPTGVKSARWKDMGWQGEDPGTDFRGAGYLALENLLYLACRHRDTFVTLMEKTDGVRSELEYPFAAAGCNVTFLLVECLDLRDGSRLPKTLAGRCFLKLLGESASAFEELYVTTFQVLDIVWLKEEASYMDFPKVLAATKSLVEAALVKNLDTLEATQEELLRSCV